MAKTNAKREAHPLKQPRVVTKWYQVDDFKMTIERCRACGEPFTITREHLEAGRYIVCPCRRGCFEVELRVVHTVESV